MEILLLPSVIRFFDFQSLCDLPFLCKTANVRVNQITDDIGYWLGCCHAYVYHNGLFMRTDEGMILKNARKYFFDELLVAKHKWNCPDETDGKNSIQTFKIKVSCRFRPGDRGQQNMSLPLHQFLKVKREARAKEKLLQKETSDLLLGEVDPVEYLDPFLGYLMREPVLLQSSGKICERAIAIQCILRGSKDPFNGERLTREMIIPQPELSSQILAWRLKKESVDISVGVSEVKTLIDEGTIDPELLDALMEATSLDHISRRAQIDARSKSKNDAYTDDNCISSKISEENSSVLEEFNLRRMSTDDTDLLGNSIEVVNEISNILSTDNLHEESLSSKFAVGKGFAARVIDLNISAGCASMHVPGVGVKQFHFSNLYDGISSQSAVYSTSANDSIVAALNGFNSCILCYGQTGSGKTYTSFGPENSLDDEISLDDDLPESSGLIVRSCRELLKAKDILLKSGVYLSLSAQFVEIYDEKVTDLLSGKTVSVRRDSGDLVGVSEANIDGGMSDLMNIIRQGHARKRFAATEMNDRSSRSHTALIIQITQTRSFPRSIIFDDHTVEVVDTSALEAVLSSIASKIDDETDVTTVESMAVLDENIKLVKSQLHLIDLAGSERVKKSKATGTGLKEAIGINSSLLVLGKVIAALVESQHHVPYLESKLTTMLRGAFGGNSRTTAIITCRSDDAYGDETLQSMRFGQRCGMITNANKVAAITLQTAMEQIDLSLKNVSEQLISLELRGKHHLDSYQKLLASFNLMQRKRDDLARSFTGNRKAFVS